MIFILCQLVPVPWCRRWNQGGFGSPPFLPSPPPQKSFSEGKQQHPPLEIPSVKRTAATRCVSCQFLFAYRMLCFLILFLSASWSSRVPFSSPPWGPPTSQVPGPSPPIPTAGCQWWLRFSGQEQAVALNLSTDCFASVRFDSFISTGQHGCREPYFNYKQLILYAALSLNHHAKVAGQGRRSCPYWVKLCKLVSRSL